MVPGHFLLNNSKQALRIISTSTAKLDAYCALYLNENLDFGSWAAKELAYLKAIKSEPKQDVLRVTYVEELEKLAKLKYNIVISAVVILIFYRHALQLSRDVNFLSYSQSSFICLFFGQAYI